MQRGVNYDHSTYFMMFFFPFVIMFVFMVISYVMARKQGLRNLQ